MPSAETLLIVSLVIAVDVVVFYALRVWMRGVFESLVKRFPARPVEHGALTKRFQSLRLGVTSFGFSFEIALDETHAHFSPHRLGRWFGAQRFSVPREVLATGKKIGLLYTSVKLLDWRLLAPNWVFEPRGDAPKSLRRA
jgi:hypothetical protein